MSGDPRVFMMAQRDDLETVNRELKELLAFRLGGGVAVDSDRLETLVTIAKGMFISEELHGHAIHLEGLVKRESTQYYQSEEDTHTVETNIKPSMRAKFYITHVEKHRHSSPGYFDAYDVLHLQPVYKNEYDETGLDENNTFAKYTPSGELRMVVNNPALVGVYEGGDTFYLDFTLAPVSE